MIKTQTLTGETTDKAHFPLAISDDGRFEWYHGSPSYVRFDGRDIYAQYPDADLDPETITQARTFLAEVYRVQDSRKAAQRHAITELEQAAPARHCPHYTSDQGCPLHGETCHR